jgi:chemotaxis protein MotB
MKKKKHQGEHENSERWLLTYADLITLLLGLFVILYAMSKVDAGKYAQMVEALSGVFGKGKEGMLEGNNGVVLPPIPVKNERDRIADEIRGALRSLETKNLVSITQDERGLTVHLMEELLFMSGSADLKESSLNIIDSLAVVMRNLPNNIRVEGHTDDVPINTPKFPSNWHLSVARALNTAFYLIAKGNLDPQRVSIAGYSEYQPIAPNNSAINRAHNRRVDLVIVVNSNMTANNSITLDSSKIIQPMKEKVE